MTKQIVNDYQGLALRTLSSTSFLDKDCEKFCTLSQLHGAMGLVTEIREIETDASKQEEIGDCLWFLSVLADSVGMNIGELARNGTVFVRKNLLATSSLAKVDQTKKLEAAAIYMLDCAKASIFYGREYHKNLLHKGQKLDWNGVIQTGILEATNALAYLCVIYKIDIYETMERNIAKLALRYPEKFDTDKASNRDVKSELEVFKSKVKAVVEAEIRKGGIIDKNPKEDGGEVIPELKELMQSEVVFTVTDEHAEEMNSHPTDEVNPEELIEDSAVIEVVEESVVIEEIPAEEIPADIQEKMDEVGAAMGEFIAAKEISNKPAKEVEFSAEKLVEVVEETAEEAKVDKKKPGRKKNN